MPRKTKHARQLQKSAALARSFKEARKDEERVEETTEVEVREETTEVGVRQEDTQESHSTASRPEREEEGSPGESTSESESSDEEFDPENEPPNAHGGI